jgi:hypothetical protein
MSLQRLEQARIDIGPPEAWPTYGYVRKVQQHGKQLQGIGVVNWWTALRRERVDGDHVPTLEQLGRAPRILVGENEGG